VAKLILRHLHGNSKVLPQRDHGMARRPPSRSRYLQLFQYALHMAAGTHWSEGTLGLLPKNLVRCVLTPRSSKAVSHVSFPPSSYSVFGKKNVSQENENNFTNYCRSFRCLGTGQAEMFFR